MEKAKFVKLSIITIALTLCIAAIIVTFGFVAKSSKNESDLWVLHSYGNNVALYKNEQVVEVYSGILLDTLPEEDKRQLDNGLLFHSKEEALTAIEDYDG